MSKEIEKRIESENWRGARKLIRAALREEPNNHWLVTRLGLTYHEERKYKKALVYEERALALATHCPLVLWDYAGTLDMLGQTKPAINIYQKLASIGAWMERWRVVAPPMWLHAFLRAMSSDSPALKPNDSCRNFLALF